MNRIAFLSICLLVFTIPWANMILVPGVGTISRVIGLPVLAIGLFSAVYNQNIRFQLMHKVVLAFGVWAGLTYFWSIEPDFTQKTLISYTQNIVMMWLIYQWAVSVRDINGLFIAYVLGASVAIAATVFGYLQGSQNYYRFSALGFNPNDMAYILAFGVPMAWYLALTEKKSISIWLYRLYPALALFAVILTASRGGFIVTLIGLSFIVLSLRELSSRGKIVFLMACFVAIYILILYVPVESVVRIATIGSEIGAGSLNSRLDIWTAGLDSLGGTSLGGLGALWGRGAGCFPVAIMPYLSAEPAHNVFLSMLVEVGAVGFLIFIYILLLSLSSVQKLPALERLLWLVLLLEWGVAAMTSNLQWRKETWLLLGILIAHCSAFSKIKKVSE